MASSSLSLLFLAVACVLLMPGAALGRVLAEGGNSTAHRKLACSDNRADCTAWGPGLCGTSGVPTLCPCMCGGGGGGGSTPTYTPTPQPTASSSTSSGSGNVLYSGTASGTYYYDVRTTCPQDAWGYPETDGYPRCTSNSPGPYQQTLRQVGSDNVIAIDQNLLNGDRGRYCGKKVIVTYNGNRVYAPDGGDFFVWDACEACIGGGRIDFSVSGLRQVNSDACNLGVVSGVQFQVVDEVVKTFVP